MKIIKIFLVLSLIVLCSTIANASLKVSLFGKYNGISVKLRWLPSNKNLKYTYKLYRNEEGESDKKLIASLKKMRGDEAEKFLPKKYKGVKAFLYPLSYAKTKKQKMQIITQAERIVDFQLMMADHDILFAQALGIGYSDKTTTKNKNYTYILKVYNTKNKEIANESINISTTNISTLLPVKSVKIDSKTMGVGIKWKYFNQYSAYNIYRSNAIKGKYIKLNDRPVAINYKIDKNGVVDAPPYFFIDDTLKNYETHYYKVTGVDFFGDESPMSLTQIGSKLKPKPKVTEVKKPKISVFEDKIIISWKKLEKKPLKYYDIYRSYKSDANYVKLNKKPLKQHTYTDKNVLEKIAYFYVIIGVYKDGTLTKTAPVFGIPWDNTAPSKPKNVKAVSKPGKITLSWEAVKDKSLLGYRVFRTLNPKKDSSWHMVSGGIIKTQSVVDILPKTQDKQYYYYKVVALDENQNISKPSKLIKILLPDVTAPLKPVIISQVMKKDYIDLHWIASPSKDTIGYNIYKKANKKILKINTNPLSALEYKDYAVKVEKKTAYSVSAVDRQGNESKKSDWISLKFRDKIPPKIQKFTINQEVKKVIIEFTSLDNDLDGFVVYRSFDDKFFERYSSFIKDRKVFIDKKVKVGKKYYYYIVLYDKSGNTTKSKVLSIKIKQGSRIKILKE
jgi:fibronectin type 3 domain-containing protein